MSSDLEKVTEYDRKVFLVAYNASVVYKIKPDSKSGRKVNELLGYYKNYLETGDKRDLEMVKSFFVSKKSVSPIREKLPRIQVGGNPNGTPEKSRNIVARNLTEEELFSTTTTQRKEIYQVVQSELDKKSQSNEIDKEVIRNQETTQRQLNAQSEQIAMLTEMVGKLIEKTELGQTKSEKISHKTFLEIHNSNPKNLSWKDTAVGYMTLSFKKLLSVWPKATYEVAKFCVYNTFIYPVKYTLKKIRNAYSTIVGVLGVVFIGGVIYYTYANVSENEFMNEICKEKQMILCSNWERELVYNAYRSIAEPLEIGLSYAKAPYEYSIEIAVIGWKILWKDLYKYFVSLFKALLKDAGIPGFFID